MCKEASGSSIAKMILLSRSLFFLKNEYATSINAFLFSPELSSVTGIDLELSTFLFKTLIKIVIVFLNYVIRFYIQRNQGEFLFS